MSGVLEVRGVGKTFPSGRRGAVEAVRGVSFTVEPGAICALLGPSGCGKSTLLRMLAGLETPDAGEILLGGRRLEGPGRDRGMVFQAYSSFDWLSVRKNIEFGMKISGMDAEERRERTERFLALVGLSGFAEAYPSQLSGGMRQRVAIARSLANGPEVLLLDEPFGALDAETRWQMQEMLISLAGETGTTMVVVTHDLEEAIFLADRIVFLSCRPAGVAAEIETGFKGGRVARKEEVVGLPGYSDLEARLMRLMREEARHGG